MPAEIEVYGLYVPRLLILMVLALFVSIAVRRILSLTGAYRMIWHRGLFDLAAYVLLVGALSSLSGWYFT